VSRRTKNKSGVSEYMLLNLLKDSYNMAFELGKEYHYEKIQEVTDEDGMTLTEHGHTYIGESFLVLKNENRDEIQSFVMSSYNAGLGAYYRLVYSDLFHKTMLEG
jgi:hypothetical protein